MPTYSFRNIVTDEVIERYLSYKEYDELEHEPDKDLAVYIEDGDIYYRALDLDVIQTSNQSSKGWPFECLGSGVNAEQAPELREYFKKQGLRVEVSNDGNPIYESPAQRKKALKCRGFVDKASYI